ncbi:hypothetical protein DFJ74DRAFT_500123 [Hyaloraphidium curvatum]|nr:hypothetical protein DFJ74DRAFT_500123 [Hyaloraphidium curvatum]
MMGRSELSLTDQWHSRPRIKPHSPTNGGLRRLPQDSLLIFLVETFSCRHAPTRQARVGRDRKGPRGQSVLHRLAKRHRRRKQAPAAFRKGRILRLEGRPRAAFGLPAGRGPSHPRWPRRAVRRNRSHIRRDLWRELPSSGRPVGAGDGPRADWRLVSSRGLLRRIRRGRRRTRGPGVRRLRRLEEGFPGLGYPLRPTAVPGELPGGHRPPAGLQFAGPCAFRAAAPAGGEQSRRGGGGEADDGASGVGHASAGEEEGRRVRGGPEIPRSGEAGRRRAAVRRRSRRHGAAEQNEMGSILPRDGSAPRCRAVQGRTEAGGRSAIVGEGPVLSARGRSDGGGCCGRRGILEVHDGGGYVRASSVREGRGAESAPRSLRTAGKPPAMSCTMCLWAKCTEVTLVCARMGIIRCQ